VFVVDSAAKMVCPNCRAEYRPGFTRCADCDVELVENYAEAIRHLLAKKAAISDKYGARLWQGTDPHFYVALLWSLWNKNVACYGGPENPPIPESVSGPHPVSSAPAGFEVWVSEENLPLAKWILDSSSEEFEKTPPEDRPARGMAAAREFSPDTTGVCPLCFGEFTTASSYCPNCGVTLRSLQPDIAAEDSARTLCNLGHPKFITELRRALQTAGIPFNNANFSSGDIISGRYYIPNYEVLVLDEDCERATQVMSQVLQHWEFEPSAGFGIGRDPQLGYWPVRASQNGWLREDISAVVWSGQNLVSLGTIGMALQEHEIPYRVETEQLGTAKVFSHPEDEARAREIVREVLEGVSPD
jgi:hypothetical protein